MNKHLIRFGINALAFFIAITLLNGNGINAQHMEWWGYLGLALIFGVVNALLRPLVVMLGCPFIVLSLGLGMLLVNTLMFYLAGLIGLQFGVGFTVNGFLPALLGALIIGAIDMVGGWVVKDSDRKKKK
jgi:putative membrane protein